MSVNDFESLSIIGRGAFGEVRLCRTKQGELVAIKKMKKDEMIKKKNIYLHIYNFFFITIIFKKPF